MAIISLAAMLGAFAYLLSAQMVNSFNHAVAGVIAIISMIIIMKVADKKDIPWLKEWALGIAMLIGMTSAYFTSLI